MEERRRAWAPIGMLIVLVLLVAPFIMSATQFVTICHRPGPLEDPFGQNAKTTVIPVSALSAHLAHGDTIGPCPEDAPTPRPTPRPTPKPTPRPTPRATPGPTLRPTPTPSPGSGAQPTQPATDTE